jgi:hypothetical protein
VLPLKIIRIERDRHRLGLSLKQARDRGEIMGFRFGPDGEVVYVPEEIKEQFQDEIRELLEDRAGEAPSEGSQTSPVEVALPREPEPVAALISARQNDDQDDEEPQTQMAAAFAALKLEDLASDTPPEETKA